MSGVGYLLAAGSAILNGSFVAFSKLERVKKAGVDPLVFQMWTSFGVFLSSLLTLPFITGNPYPLGAIGWGILAGGLFVCAVAFSFVAVRLVGVSIGQGIWGGSAVIISFLWGVLAFGDQVQTGMALCGILLIVIGVCGIAACGEIAARLWPQSYGVYNLDDSHLLDRQFENGRVGMDAHEYHQQTNSSHANASLRMDQSFSGSVGVNNGQRTISGGSQLSSHAASNSADWDGNYDESIVSRPLTPIENELDPAELASLKQQRQIYGCICALVVGVFGGSILMPLKLAPSDYQGLQFVPSFGLGTFLIAPLITLPYMWLSRSSTSRGNWAVKESLIPGLLAGATWNGANICSIYAIPRIGFSIAQPLMQCAIVVAAAWGVVVFKEIKGRQIIIMGISALIVLAGAALLAVSKE